MEKVSPPTPVVLSDLDPSVPILFRLKVIGKDGSTGRLLGSAEKIRPLSSDDEADGRKSLFPIVTRSIGQEIWHVQITEAGPELVLNLRFPGLKQTLLKDAILRGAILPAALRYVLDNLLNDPDGFYDDDNSWRSDWMSFCTSQLGLDEPDELSIDEKDAWVSDAITRFCEYHEFLNQSLTQLEGDSR